MQPYPQYCSLYTHQRCSEYQYPRVPRDLLFLISALSTLGTREDSIISASSTLETREDAVISALSTQETREDSRRFGFRYPRYSRGLSPFVLPAFGTLETREDSVISALGTLPYGVAKTHLFLPSVPYPRDSRGL